MNERPSLNLLSLVLCSLTPMIGCGDDGGDEQSSAETETGTGDGDGDPATSGDGDGDGDPTTSGDGDGDPTTSGDGDGDPTTSGDGDGDPTTSGDGDGDGDPTTSGDGDGDPTTSGDGDGDGDPTTSGDGDGDGGDGDGDGGDGDGDGGFDFDCDPNLDPVILVLGQQSARYPTIADAVFAAPDGGLVQICPGEYDETEVVVDDDIEIQGAGPGLTIWSPADGGALYIDAEDVIVRDLTITGGSGVDDPPGFNASCGGAIFVARDFNMARTVLLSNLLLDGNMAELGGGVCISGGNGNVPTVTIEDSVITNNTAVREGGGLFVHGRFHLVNTIVSDNIAELQGGGGLNVNYGCRNLQDCSITDSAILHNTAAGGMWSNGGGMWLGGFLQNGDQGAAVTVTNSDFGFGFDEENQPDDVFTIFDLMPTSYGFYGNGVSFTCEDGVCTDP